MDPGLRGDDLLLQAGQEPLALGQGQTQGGQVGEVVGLGDPQDVGAVLLPLGSGAHQSHDPGRVVSTSTGKSASKILRSVLHPPISRQSLPVAAGVLYPVAGILLSPVIAALAQR